MDSVPKEGRRHARIQPLVTLKFITYILIAQFCIRRTLSSKSIEYGTSCEDFSSFSRWLEYKNGFGNLYGEFWLGNDPLHFLTSQMKYKLRIDLSEWEGNVSRAEYETFSVDSESKKYMLHVKNYIGHPLGITAFH